jgi:hypothetical protein
MKSKYVDVREIGTSASGLTRLWTVVNIRTGEIVGQIRWYGAWRRYAFYPKIEDVDWIAFDAECLGQIVEKLQEVNAQRRSDRRAA